MFRKQGVCITTAAGAGMKSTIKDMADSLFFWGVPRIYRLGKPVAATDWSGVSEKKKQSVRKAANTISKKLIKKQGTVKPGLKTKGFFKIMRMLQKNGWNESDVRYWKDMGWLGKKRPWKDTK